MSGINKFIEWLEENQNQNLSNEFIKLQAKVFALQEQYSLERFEIVTNILNQKINKTNNEKTEYEKLYINYLYAQK